LINLLPPVGILYIAAATDSVELAAAMADAVTLVSRLFSFSAHEYYIIF